MATKKRTTRRKKNIAVKKPRKSGTAADLKRRLTAKVKEVLGDLLLKKELAVGKMKKKKIGKKIRAVRSELRKLS